MCQVCTVSTTLHLCIVAAETLHICIVLAETLHLCIVVAETSRDRQASDVVSVKAGPGEETQCYQRA